MSAVQSVDKPQEARQQIGRYTIFDRIASGGMATVHFARLVGREGFCRVVVAKRLHRHFLENTDFKQMFLDEARVAARVRHPNVVPILDVLSDAEELVLFMEYVHGESLHALLRLTAGEPFPIPIAGAIMTAALEGLHAAHEARSESGEPLGIVHRDVSPQNVLVGADGVTRVVDFGVAKAMRSREDTKPGVIKGKLSYLAPEVFRGAPVTRATDIFSAAVVFWELLTGRKLFGGANDEERMVAILRGGYPSPRQFNTRISERLEGIVAQGLEVDPARRFPSARDFAIAIEREIRLAPPRVVGRWVSIIGRAELEQRANLICEIETSSVQPIPVEDSTEAVELDSQAAPAGLPSQPTQVRRVSRSPAVVAVVCVLLAVASALALVLALRSRARPSYEALRPSVEAPSALPPLPPEPPSPPPQIVSSPLAAADVATAQGSQLEGPVSDDDSSHKPGRTIATPPKGPARPKRPSKGFFPSQL